MSDFQRQYALWDEFHAPAVAPHSDWRMAA